MTSALPRPDVVTFTCAKCGNTTTVDRNNPRQLAAPHICACAHTPPPGAPQTQS